MQKSWLCINGKVRSPGACVTNELPTTASQLHFQKGGFLWLQWRADDSWLAIVETEIPPLDLHIHPFKVSILLHSLDAE